MAGLLEILVDQGGRADLHVLADELSLEVDALLPTVDTAALLGLLKVEEGDTIITPKAWPLPKPTFRNARLSFARLLLPTSRSFVKSFRSYRSAAGATGRFHCRDRVVPGHPSFPDSRAWRRGNCRYSSHAPRHPIVAEYFHFQGKIVRAPALGSTPAAATCV
ncbi:MAG: AAA-associated domain-containing protein [Candidatus Acidiferrum sp.]